GSLIGKITLHGGFTFTTLNNNRVIGFAAPDAFFVEDHEVKLKDFSGKWTLTEEQAAALARKTVKSLGVPSQAVAGVPKIDKPYGAAKDLVPRYLLSWMHERQNVPSVRME